MKFAAVLRIAAAALATGALLIPTIGPAKAATTYPYPPHVSVLYASPFLSGGYASVSVSGTDLTTGLTVRASSGTKSTVAKLYVDSTRTVGTALVKVSSVISTTAGRYTVYFSLWGASNTATTTQSYAIGTFISIKSFKVTPKSYGLYIAGKAAKSAPVKITIKFGSKTYTKTVKSSRTSGNFYYRFYKTSKGTYTVTAKVAPNTKYFSDAVTTSYTRR